MYSRLDTVCKYLLSIEVINGWGRQTWVSGLGPCACFLVRLQYIQRFCPRQPHGRKAQSLLECPAKWRLSDAGEVQSQWMRRAESDARHHNEALHGYCSARYSALQGIHDAADLPKPNLKRLVEFHRLSGWRRLSFLHWFYGWDCLRRHSQPHRCPGASDSSEWPRSVHWRALLLCPR